MVFPSHARVDRLAIAVLAVLMSAACGASPAAIDAATSYSRSIREHVGAGSRSVLDLTTSYELDIDDSPVVVSASVADVRADRGWRNLPESEIHEGIDTEEVPFDADDAAFRTILVTLVVNDVLRPGGQIHDPAWGSAIADGDPVAMTMVLFPDSTLEAAQKELLAIDDVVVPLVETDRGAFGRVLEPYGGWDIVIDIRPDGDRRHAARG